MFDSFAKAFSYSNRYFCVKLFILESKAWFRGTIKEILQKIILVWIAVFWAHHLVQIAKPYCNKAYWNCNLKKKPISGSIENILSESIVLKQMAFFEYNLKILFYFEKKPNFYWKWHNSICCNLQSCSFPTRIRFYILWIRFVG